MIRKATVEDVEKILHFIKELAKYEKMENDVAATSELIREWIFEKKKANVIFAMGGEKEVGYALYFYNYSTFTGKAGIYLELFNELKRICKDEKLGRIDWQCLDWNEPSIKFYDSLGAKKHSQWLNYRLGEREFT